MRALAQALGAAPPQAISDLSNAVTLIGGRAPVDILFDELPGQLRFASLRARAIQVAVADATLTAASLPDIIASKRAANRPKDLAQLAVLEAALRVRQEIAKS